MSLEVISFGFGRTATMSLKAALEELGYGPCYHMDVVLQNMEERVPQWSAAVEGRPDWAAIYSGFHSAVDWPTSAFWRELVAALPEAKFILSSRSVESWYESISQTILAVLTAREKWPEAQREWLEMVSKVVIDRSLGGRDGQGRRHRSVRGTRGHRQRGDSRGGPARVPGRRRMGPALRVPREARAR